MRACGYRRRRACVRRADACCRCSPPGSAIFRRLLTRRRAGAAGSPALGRDGRDVSAAHECVRHLYRHCRLRRLCPDRSGNIRLGRRASRLRGHALSGGVAMAEAPCIAGRAHRWRLVGRSGRARARQRSRARSSSTKCSACSSRSRFSTSSVTGAIVGFVLFRVLDVIKPYPAGRARAPARRPRASCWTT